jgi:hypothetical protein
VAKPSFIQEAHKFFSLYWVYHFSRKLVGSGKTYKKLLLLQWSHHAEGLVDPNLMNKKTVTGFRYPRACRFRKYQFENRSWELPLSTFFKT